MSGARDAGGVHAYVPVLLMLCAMYMIGSTLVLGPWSSTSVTVPVVVGCGNGVSYGGDERVARVRLATYCPGDGEGASHWHDLTAIGEADGVSGGIAPAGHGDGGDEAGEGRG